MSKKSKIKTAVKVIFFPVLSALNFIKTILNPVGDMVKSTKKMMENEAPVFEKTDESALERYKNVVLFSGKETVRKNAKKHDFLSFFFLALVCYCLFEIVIFLKRIEAFPSISGAEFGGLFGASVAMFIFFLLFLKSRYVVFSYNKKSLPHFIKFLSSPFSWFEIRR